MTRDFKQTVQARVRRDPAFRRALLREGLDCFIAGDVETGKTVLRDYINATVGFDALAVATERAMATTVTSREFDQDAAGARKASRRGPVFITDRGRPAHVLLTIEDYRRLAGRGGATNLAQAVAQPNADFEFEPARLGEGLSAPIDLA